MGYFFRFFGLKKKRVPSRIDLQNSFEVFFLVLKNRHTFPLEFPTRNLNFVVFFWFCLVFFSQKTHLQFSQNRWRSGSAAWSSCFQSARSFDAKLSQSEDVYEALAKAKWVEFGMKVEVGV